jgi:hypothetical protein
MLLMQKTFLAVLVILLFLPNLFNKDIHSIPVYDKKEKFNQQLAYINSISKLEAYTDSIALKKNTPANSFEYAILLESVVKDRFYHGFSHFSLSENWIAAVSGRWLEEGLACKVQPEEIMHHNNAACSQQSIVMMAILRNKNISYRNVGFPHHYALEVLINNNWYFIDADMEPVITKEQRILSSWNHQNDYLKKYYNANRFSDLDYKFGTGLTATTGPVNEMPALNARIFHAATAILSKILWCFPLLLIFFKPRFSFSRAFTLNIKRRSAAPVSLAV